ncbi:hypothetical protein EHW67_15980 [Arenibacter aquaticus]|uniref:Uncharacterized protein n=1 Tax=Arenibacter aquaticus TaxID=2489054 RepID=A0A430K0I0_9FLAO|nr:hypothetical protein [Arenibacter aquaticus]RTE52567.1 hypothetical protein EHW67_15980 [Arenibacter aquaticus]
MNLIPENGLDPRGTGIDHASGVPYFGFRPKKKVPSSDDEGTSEKGGGLSMTVPERQQSAARRDTGIDHAEGVPYFGFRPKKSPLI